MKKEEIILVEEAWKIMINKLTEEKQEFHTVPKTNKKPVWFEAESDGKDIFVNSAKSNEPSSKISSTRKLKYNNFIEVYPLYIKRENGEKVSQEVTNKTVNQVYYFSLIKQHIQQN